MAKQFTLSKNERLKSRKLIEKLFNTGKSFTVAPYKILYSIYSLTPNPKFQTSNIKPQITNLQFGVGVSSKNFRKAVDRNRIKRLTREGYRLRKLDLQRNLEEKNIQLNVFFIYTDKELPEYKNVYEKMKVALQRLIAEIDRTIQ